MNILNVEQKNIRDTYLWGTYIMLIYCKHDCKYQEDGICNLKTAAPILSGAAVSDCVYYVSIKDKSFSAESTAEVADTSDTN